MATQIQLEAVPADAANSEMAEIEVFWRMQVLTPKVPVKSTF